MTLEDINYIAQTIGVAAILGTFVAVLMQMRQTNRLLRNQARRAQIDGAKAISEAMYQTPGLAGIMARAITEGLYALPPAERMQLLAYMMAAERTWEGMFVQYQDGLIDEELWQAHIRHTRAAWNDNTAAMREFWRLRREYFMPAYREFREAEIAQLAQQAGVGETSDTLGYASGAPPRAAETKDPTPVEQPERVKE